MIFVERKCWMLTFKVGYTFFAGHPVESLSFTSDHHGLEAYVQWSKSLERYLPSDILLTKGS